MYDMISYLPLGFLIAGIIGGVIFVTGLAVTAIVESIIKWGRR